MLDQLSEIHAQDQKQAAEASSNDSSTAGQDTYNHLPAPNRQVSNSIWLITVVTLAIILVGCFVTLALGTFLPLPAGHDANMQMILTIFTTIVGFMAGLFTTSPFQATGKKG